MKKKKNHAVLGSGIIMTVAMIVAGMSVDQSNVSVIEGAPPANQLPHIEMPAPDSPDNEHANKITTITTQQNDKNEGIMGSQAIRAAFSSIADQYEQQALYPPYSIPVRDARDLARLLRDNKSRSYVPWKFDDGAEIELGMNTDRYNYEPGDLLTWTINSNKRINNVKVAIRTKNGETLVDGGKGVQGSIKIPGKTPDDVEYLVVAEASFRGRPINILTPIRIESPVAIITGVESSDVCGNNLCINVNVDVRKAGYYYIQSVLYNQNAKPLSYLSAEGNLEKGHQIIKFRVYGKILKDAQDEGDYWISDFNVVRSAGIGEKYDSYGKSQNEPFRVTGYSLSAYSDETWHDPLMDERIAFLRQIGNGGG
jgi:hypothetical protein